jgi:NTE family protein
MVIDSKQRPAHASVIGFHAALERKRSYEHKMKQLARRRCLSALRTRLRETGMATVRMMSMQTSCPPKQPTLALVIGSGGIRSASAIGVLDVLHREGIRPDVIVGSSSGALFGAALALGLAPAHVLRLAKTLWTQELTEQRRWKAYLQLLAPRLAGFDAGFSLRGADLIARRVGEVFGHRRIEELPIALRVSATDAASGAATVIHRGPVAQAVMASMAVPFMFPSVVFEGRRLIDGVVSDPTPLAAASDTAVVLSLSFAGSLPRRIDRASRLAAQVSTALINNLQDARMSAAVEIARLQQRRIIGLEPLLSRRVGLWETAALPEVFQAGQRAAQERLADIGAALALAPLRAAAEVRHAA